MPGWLIVGAFTMAAAIGPTLTHADAMAELDDAEARAQYAFYTADIRALEDVVRVIEGLQVPDILAATKAYDAAYGRWKLAQLLADAAAQDRKHAARGLVAKAAQACQAHARSATTLDPRMADAYAIDAACAKLVQEPRAGDSRSAAACSRSKSLRTALELEPDNPRVMLIEAMCLDDVDGVSGVAIFEQLQKIAAAFESAPPSHAGSPDWGQAEALVLLGRSYLQRSDMHAARDVIEKALVIAPDYRKARELLAIVAARPHD